MTMRAFKIFLIWFGFGGLGACVFFYRDPLLLLWIIAWTAGLVMRAEP